MTPDTDKYVKQYIEQIEYTIHVLSSELKAVKGGVIPSHHLIVKFRQLAEANQRLSEALQLTQGENNE